MKHHIDLLGCKYPPHHRYLTNIRHQEFLGNSLKRRNARQFPFQMKQGRFCLVQIQYLGRPKIQYLPAYFRTNAPRGSGNQYGFSKQGRIHILLIQLNHLSAQQFVHIQGAKIDRSNPLVQHILQLGNQLQLDPLGQAQFCNVLFSFSGYSVDCENDGRDFARIYQILLGLFQRQNAFALKAFALFVSVIIYKGQHPILGLNRIVGNAARFPHPINDYGGLI